MSVLIMLMDVKELVSESGGCLVDIHNIHGIHTSFLSIALYVKFKLL